MFHLQNVMPPHFFQTFTFRRHSFIISWLFISTCIYFSSYCLNEKMSSFLYFFYYSTYIPNTFTYSATLITFHGATGALFNFRNKTLSEVLQLKQTHFPCKSYKTVTFKRNCMKFVFSLV